jgi:hypothetical protein
MKVSVALYVPSVFCDVAASKTRMYVSFAQLPQVPESGVPLLMGP